MHYLQGEDRQELQITTLDSMIEIKNPVRLLDYIIEQIFLNNPDSFCIKGQSLKGRRAYSPVTMIKLFLYGYLHRIPSSRCLERECCKNIELQWLLQNLKPDYRTIADFRKNNPSLIQTVKVEFRKMLIEAGLIKQELVAIDGTKIKANASNSFYTQENLKKLIEETEFELAGYLDLLNNNDVQNEVDELLSTGAEPLSGTLEERIQILEEALHKLHELKDYSEQNGNIHVNPHDPDSRRMRNHEKKEAAYNLQLAVDDTNKMIVADEVIQDANDQNAMLPVLVNLSEELGVEPDKVVMDMGYNNPLALMKLEKETDIEAFVVVESDSPNKQAEYRFSKWDFTYDSDSDTYTCPAGQILHRRGNVSKTKKRFTTKYICKKSVCAACIYRAQCVRGKEGRNIARYTDEEWVENYRKKMKGSEAQVLLRKRKSIIEHIFGVIKRWMGSYPLLLRGLSKVKTEISLYTTAYNFHRLVQIGGFEKQPWNSMILVR